MGLYSSKTSISWISQMPSSRVIPKRLPVCPGRDSRFTIRHNSEAGGAWWVYYEAPGKNLIPADSPHKDLVSLVNELKEAEGVAPGGSFSINEHSQVIARMSAPAGYAQNTIHVVDISTGAVQTYADTITFQSGGLDPTALPNEGDEWPGPRCGMTYRFAAPGNKKPPSHRLDEIWTEIEGQVELLSPHAGVPYPPPTGSLANFLGALRRRLPSGGRFRVNERGRAFTADKNLFIGLIPLASWFPALSII
jgi:hypothetical protein